VRLQNHIYPNLQHNGATSYCRYEAEGNGINEFLSHDFACTPQSLFWKFRRVETIVLQCSDTAGWATGRASGLYKAWCWFVSGDSLTGALHVLQIQLLPSPASSLAPTKSRMDTFWYRINQVQLENGRRETERVSK